jgi:hypothetical protein
MDVAMIHSVQLGSSSQSGALSCTLFESRGGILYCEEDAPPLDIVEIMNW